MLASSYRVYAVDLPNHGRSPHVSDCTLQSMACAVSGWMDEQKLESAVILGHSLGGKVAMELALMQSAKVEALIVLDIAPVSYVPRHNDVFKGLLAIRPGELSSREEADKILCEYGLESAVRTFLLKNLVRDTQGFKWRMNLHDIHKSYQQLISANRLGTYIGRTLFVKAENSDYIVEGYRQDIIGRFPNAQLKIASDTAHWLHAEKPELIARIALRSLEVCS